MRLEIKSPTFLRGKLLKVGAIIEADDLDRDHLLASGRAVRAQAKPEPEPEPEPTAKKKAAKGK